jgi:hypothetical protein
MRDGFDLAARLLAFLALGRLVFGNLLLLGFLDPRLFCEPRSGFCFIVAKPSLNVRWKLAERHSRNTSGMDDRDRYRRDLSDPRFFISMTICRDEGLEPAT